MQGRNRTNSVSSITSGSSTGSSSISSTTGQSPSSNEGFHPPPRRAALLQDRTRYEIIKFPEGFFPDSSGLQNEKFLGLFMSLSSVHFRSRASALVAKS